MNTSTDPAPRTLQQAGYDVTVVSEGADMATEPDAKRAIRQ